VRDICRAATPLPSPPRRHFRHRRLLRSGTQSPNARETPLLCSRRMRRSRVPQVPRISRASAIPTTRAPVFCRSARQEPTAPAAAEMTTVSPAATRRRRSCSVGGLSRHTRTPRAVESGATSASTLRSGVTAGSIAANSRHPVLPRRNRRPQNGTVGCNDLRDSTAVHRLADAHAIGPVSTVRSIAKRMRGSRDSHSVFKSTWPRP